MRNLVYAINLTIDGCCEHTKVSGSDEMLVYHAGLLQTADILLYGRITYQLMVPYWPDVAKSPSSSKADYYYARTFASLDKVVVSRSLEHTEDNSRIIRANLKEEILKLKNQPGKSILVGGIDLPSQLIALGLVDEFYFVIHPILAGDGRLLFEGANLPEKLKLKLVDSKTLASGSVALHYLKD